MPIRPRSCHIHVPVIEVDGFRGRGIRNADNIQPWINSFDAAIQQMCLSNIPSWDFRMSY